MGTDQPIKINPAVLRTQIDLAIHHLEDAYNANHRSANRALKKRLNDAKGVINYLLELAE